MQATFVAVLLVSVFLVHRYIRFKARISPNIPYAGEESLLSRLKVPIDYGINPVKFLVKQRQKLGNIFCVDLFLLKFVFCLGGDGNKAVFKKPEEELSFNEGLLTLMGPFLTDLVHDEEIINKALRTGLINDEMLQAYKDECKDLADELFTSWSLACEEKGSIPLFKSFSDMLYSFFVLIAFGSDYYRSRGQEMIEIVEEFSIAIRHPILQVLPHALWHLSSPGSRAFRAQRHLCDLISSVAGEHYKRKKLGLPRDDSSYLAFLCDNLEEEYVHVISIHVPFFIFAGHTNLSATIPWMFLHMRCTPGCFERCKSELDTNDPKNYLDACFRETGRLYSSSLIMRQIPLNRPNGYSTIMGHDIPAGTLVACSPVATHQDSNVFDEPERWIPERFLADEGKAYARWFQGLDFVQFGAGAHTCIGQKLTRVLFYELILDTWLRKYNIEVVDGLKEREGYDNVGIEPDWNKAPNGTPPGMGRDVFVKVTKLS